MDCTLSLTRTPETPPTRYECSDNERDSDSDGKDDIQADLNFRTQAGADRSLIGESPFGGEEWNSVKGAANFTVLKLFSGSLFPPVGGGPAISGEQLARKCQNWCNGRSADLA